MQKSLKNKVVTILLIFMISAYFIYDLNANGTAPHIHSDSPSAIDRVRAAKEYVRYSYRAKKYDEPFSQTYPLIRKRAKYIGLDRSGNIHLDVYTEQGKQKIYGRIADINFKEIHRAPAFITKEVGYSSVIIDSYLHEKTHHFVIWLKDGTPLNEALILNGLASPSDTPPTNIVNGLFRDHYKSIAFGKK